MIFGLTVGDSNLITTVDGILPSKKYSVRHSGLGGDQEVAPQLDYSLGDSKTICMMQSQISSLHLNSTTRTLITTSPGDSHLPAMHITRLLDPTQALSAGNLDGGILTQFRLTNTSTIFCSAINPWPNVQETIAIGTGGPGSIQLFHAATESPRVSGWRQEEGKSTGSDLLAIDWLSRNLLAAGLRDGTVALYDVRARQGVKRMRHSGGVLNLKRADRDTRFVCTGMGSKMALYDLRALREEDAVSTGPKKRRTGKSKATPAQDHVAKPVLTFQYDNEYDMLGMDICPEIGVVAAAESSGQIRISSLRTGKSVAVWKMSAEPGDRIGCVRFVEDGMGAPKLMASCGSKIVEMSW
jgi:WD40 repeat protein